MTAKLVKGLYPLPIKCSKSLRFYINFARYIAKAEAEAEAEAEEAAQT